MFIGALSKLAPTMRKCCEVLFALQRMQTSQQPFMFWQCLARFHSPLNVAFPLVQWADVHSLLAQQNYLLTQNQFPLWYLKFCPVATESNVANWKVQWLVFLGFFSALLRAEDYFTHNKPSFLLFTSDNNIPAPNCYFCWKFQQKQFCQALRKRIPESQKRENLQWSEDYGDFLLHLI